MANFKVMVHCAAFPTVPMWWEPCRQSSLPVQCPVGATLLVPGEMEIHTGTAPPGAAAC